jgi:hypothetical protein
VQTNTYSAEKQTMDLQMMLEQVDEDDTHRELVKFDYWDDQPNKMSELDEEDNQEPFD